MSPRYETATNQIGDLEQRLELFDEHLPALLALF